MDENTSDKNRGRRTPHVEQGVTLEEVLNVNQGDAIAVRTDEEPSGQIVTGQVSSTLADEASPEEAIEERLEEYTSAVILSVEADVWWELSDREIIDRSCELENRPPIRGHPSDPPKDPPSCSLSYREDGRIGLTIPMPVSNGSRVLYYAPDDFGTVIALDHGAIVDSDQFLPANFESR